ncbi:subtilisin family serine protease [Promicromonospora sp. AC04]|uniref:S8 family serine peptidase n=1 Tax=Promicromonospora sp. AC04 TaxID=2135723 RepID=UPI000D4090B7|nr:S8 family serine peptidase [Promicromonospora sp. AC04]PUB23874.1 subtilisin family serine protease [Promicromonospora sp. AC04]
MRARAGAAAVLAAVLVGGGTAASAAGPGSPPPASTSAAPTSATTGSTSATVTLITGDRVTFTRSADGPRGVTIERGAGREGVGFLQQTVNDRLYVIPTDVADLVPDRLDRALFDVTRLVDAGYHESHQGTVPVIVQANAASGEATKGTRAASAEPDWADLGIEPERKLESVDAVAADLDRAAAGDLLAALQAPAPDARAATAAASGVKVWLDAPVQALDADSTPQIGAPEAWAAGYTGEGVTVAVLDTGVDTTHPDLDDVTVGSRDFTGTGNTADGFGHGTHVASIALGSGDASDGVNRGVAPGADLLVGKVLDNDGYGEMSWVIDGMEWAAGEGADVVNLSLGESGNYSDGTDPASLAVNTLSAQYDTLFVISAGNDGELGNGTVTSPGSADAALTVGAVDDADEVTWFSSRGPRGGDNALKPDVTAPGDAIVAARAAGTAMDTVVDEYHVAASGTSMAAPHVAGAAAVLKQARPELTGQELKSILMGSAQHTSGSVWEEGAGRVYLPTALEQRVEASPSSLSFGTFEYPQSGSETRTLTYENPTDADVTLDLALDATGPDGEPLPAGAAALSAASVTVPAQGTATVDLTVDTAAGAAGRVSGAVVATTPGGGEIRTTLGWDKEPELYDLTVEVLGRDGATYDGEASVGVMNVDDGTRFNEFVQLEGGTQTVRVPVGTYSVAGKLWDEDAEGAITELTAAVEPEVEVTADTTAVLDAGDGEPVTVTTQRPADLQQISLGVDRTDEPYEQLNGFGAIVPGTAEVYATPTAPVTEGGLDFSTGFALAAPTTGDEAPAYTYDLLYAQDGVETVDFAATSENTAAVRAGYADLGDGAVVQSGWFGELEDKWWIYKPGYPRPATTGSVRTEYLSADVSWRSFLDIEPADGSDTVLFNSENRIYTGGEEDAETYGGAVLNTQVRADRVFETQGDLLALNIAGWTDAEGHQSSAYGVSEHLRVWQDGTQVADVEDFWADVPVPAEGADYRVALDAVRDTSWWNRSTRVSTEWTFHAKPGGSAEEPVDLPVLDVGFAVAGMDLANKAPARTKATLTVRHQPGTTGSKIVETRLWWSPDDGATWRKATLNRTGDGVYTADLRVPAGTEQVSLRVEAKDKAGATIKQTVIDAYGVR